MELTRAVKKRYNQIIAFSSFSALQQSGISNLLDTSKISYAVAYRAQSKNTNVDPYVLFAWQRMCELLTKNTDIADEVDVEKLRLRIPDIKKAMFMRAGQIQRKLSEIFSECGIAFRIVPNFTGAPVQGFRKPTL